MLKRENVLLTFFRADSQRAECGCVARLAVVLQSCKFRAASAVCFVLVQHKCTNWHWHTVALVVVYSCCSCCHIWHCSGAVGFISKLFAKIVAFCIIW